MRKALVVDKTLKVLNSVTGQQVEMLYTANGQRAITSVGRPSMSLSTRSVRSTSRPAVAMKQVRCDS